MAARTPRRSFATPFVVTLAAAPACYVQSSPPPQQPQPQPQPVASGPQQGQPQQPPPVMVNPPMPQQPPPTEPATPAPAPGNTRWRVYKAPDGSCMAAFQVECKAGATCNPPPPFKYDCPPNVSVDPPITVVSNADGTACQVDYPPVKCPPNVACNPPRPQPVACPKR